MLTAFVPPPFYAELMERVVEAKQRWKSIKRNSSSSTEAKRTAKARYLELKRQGKALRTGKFSKNCENRGSLLLHSDNSDSTSVATIDKIDTNPDSQSSSIGRKRKGTIKPILKKRKINQPGQNISLLRKHHFVQFYKLRLKRRTHRQLLHSHVHGLSSYLVAM